MGYNRNLKNRRSPIVKYLKEELKNLESITDDNEIFENCDKMLKVVELKFKIEKYDSKMYNKYTNLILNDILPRRIFNLNYMKLEDYNLSIKEVNEQKLNDFKFIYLYALRYYMNLATIYSNLNKNIMNGWITEKDGKEVLFADNNEYINKALKNNPELKDKLYNHIKDVKKYLTDTKIKLETKTFYNQLQQLVSNSIKNIDKLESEGQKNFYEYHLSQLLNDMTTMSNMKEYCDKTIKCINNYLK